MKTPNIKLLLWVVLALLQLAVPTWMILREESTLEQGRSFHFRLAPVDPADPFRGRFMNLAFDVENKDYAIPSEADQTKHSDLYAVLETDEENFALISSLSAVAPTGSAYLLIPGKDWNASDSSNEKIRLRLPFKRYYMNEKQAATTETKANQILREARAKGLKSPIYAIVQIHEGHGVLSELILPDKP